MPESSALGGMTDEIKTTTQAISIVGKQTPVLFSTNNGLHLRTINTNSSTIKSGTSTIKSGNSYEVTFCDLERWTGRTETIGLTANRFNSKEIVGVNGGGGGVGGKSVRFVTEKMLLSDNSEFG